MLSVDWARWRQRWGEAALRIQTGLHTALDALIGHWEWAPPPWLHRTRDIVRNVNARIHARPRQSGGIAIATFLILGGSYAGWRWYQDRPQPVTVGFEVQAPTRTCYECDPPGKPQPLTVHFDGSVAPLRAAGKVIDARTAGISMSPAFAGEWRWQDDATLIFTPGADWPIAQSFSVTLARRGFTAPQVLLQQYRFEFTSAPFTATLDSNEFYQDPVQASDKKIVTTLAFSHPINPATLEPRIHLRLFNQVFAGHEQQVKPAPTFIVTYDKLRLHAYIHSSQLQVPAKQGRVEIRIDAGLQAQRGGNRSSDELSDSVTVPGLYSLQVERIQLLVVRDQRDNPHQALMLETSQAVTEPQMTGHVHAWVLPVRHPDPRLQADHDRYASDRPYFWNVTLVTPTVLAAAAPLPLSYVSNERDQVELHSFALTAEPGRQIYVQIDRGLQSFGGYLMADPIAQVLTVPDYPKEARIASEGALLALSGHRKIALFTRDVAALQIRVGRLLPDQLQHLVTQSRGDFAHPQFDGFFGARLDDSNLTERYTEILPVPSLPPGTPNYQTLDLGSYLTKPGAGRQGIFLLTVDAYDPVTRQPIASFQPDSPTHDTRLIVVTDLGLLVKENLDGSRDIFVQSIASGEPVGDVQLQIIGRNGEPVLSATSDTSGHAHLPDLRSFKEEQEPVLLLARHGNDSSFLPLKSHVQPLDLSRFDVGGVSNSVERSALAAYLFSDRGIYRPGDEIRAAAIVRTQDWQPLPAGVPMRIEITDPRGVAVKRETVALPAGGFQELRYRTHGYAPTGDYTLSLYMIRDDTHQELIGSSTVKVQEFLPDRLRMTLHFTSEAADGWVKPDQLQAKIELLNLFGTPASVRRVRASMHLAPAFPSFARYADYTFHDPHSARDGFDEKLTEQTTDAAGHATLNLNLSRFARATYRVDVAAEGFEADGGRAVSAEATQLVSDLPFLVGWKADGQLDFVPRDGARTINFIAVGPTLAPVATTGLTLRRIERRYVSMLIRQNSGVFKYESRLKELTLSERPWSVPVGGAALTLDASAPGDFSYVLTDADGQVYARVDYTVAGAANLTRSLEKNAELQITLNKSDYAPGETIDLQLQAPYVGAGLITIERDHVYRWQWFKTTTTASVQHIRVPDGLEGNAYVSVTFVRDPASDEIYTSPLSYGVRPFSIALDRRREPVELKAPALAKPGEALSISYRTGHPARLALFAVDEGILQVARYRTPDPLAYFFQKRALDVQTRQILDLILPEFRAAMLSAPGGDEGATLRANLNPFKRKTDAPVAFWSGIVDAGPDSRTLTWTVPDYFNGNLRIMAVAVDDQAIGVAEQSTLIRGDFVLSPNVPLTVTPGDEFAVSVGVANNIADAGANTPVQVSVDSDAALEILGPARLTVPVGALHESVAHFRFRTRDVLGSTQVRFAAEWAGHRAQLAATLSVRPATPYMTSLQAGSFRGSAGVAITRTLYPQFRTLNASVSSVPLVLAHGLSAYLQHYPYSCTEQLVSQAMPAIVLSGRPDFGEVHSLEGANLDTLIDELRSRQNVDGSYRYWAGGVQTIDFVSVYAQHVLLEASERGMAVPGDLMARSNGYLRSVARRDNDTLAQERTSAYAIYLLARQGIVVSNEATALQGRLGQRYGKEGEGDVASAYLAAAYRLMQQQDLARRLIARVPFGTAGGDRWSDPMTHDAQLLYLTARHFPERLARVPDGVLDRLAQDVQHGAYSSLSAATTILALDAYVSASQAMAPKPFTVTARLADQSRQALALPPGLFPLMDVPETARSLTFDTATRLPGFFLVNQSGFDRSAPTQALTQGLEITREFLDAQGRPASRIKVGDELTVHIQFRAIGQPQIPDAVLVDLLPGGFDLVDAEPTAPQPQFGGGRSQDFPDFADLREDRVVLYGTATDQVQEFSYRIKATNAGNYSVPPAYGTSMYNPKVQARAVITHLQVDPP